RDEQTIARRLIEKIGEPRIGGQSVDVERRASLTGAIEHEIASVRPGPDGPAKSVFGDQLVTLRLGIVQIERSLRSAKFDRAVIKDFFQFRLKFCDLRMHVLSVR